MSYNLFSRKLFSVPKLLLLPSIVLKHPLLLAKIFPLIVAADFLKGKFVATLSYEIERLKKEKKDLEGKRTQMEQFDLKNADLIQRSGAASKEFTRKTWATVTAQIQAKGVAHTMLRHTRLYFEWLQKDNIFMTLIYVALADLMAVDVMGSEEIFVFSRAMEDAIDLLLMRGRKEAELSSMESEMNRLRDLVQLWKKGGAEQRHRWVPCHVPVPERSDAGVDVDVDAPTGTATLQIRDLSFSRGTAQVRNVIEIPCCQPPLVKKNENVILTWNVGICAFLCIICVVCIIIIYIA